VVGRRFAAPCKIILNKRFNYFGIGPNLLWAKNGHFHLFHIDTAQIQFHSKESQCGRFKLVIE
jgi:hypothetical protein